MTEIEFQEKYPSRTFGEVYVVRNYEYNGGEIIDKGWVVKLPHSCGEWVIGNFQDAQKFASDLGKILEYIKNNDLKDQQK